jgi:N-acetylmuramoyl-L-alanine amidase
LTYLVIFDWGHGLNTGGKRTPNFPDGSFMRENEFNRDVGLRAYNLLEKHENIDVVFTTTEKRDIDVPERVDRINDLYKKVKYLYDKIVLVSIHANASNSKNQWDDVGGTATFYYTYNETDKKFAEVIQRNLIAKTGLASHRGGVVGEEFYIIKYALMTACLCECAFMTNKKEAELLRTDEFRQACAEGIVNGLLEYFGINDKKEVDNVKVEFKKYSSNGMTELKGNPLKLGQRVVDKKIWDITEFTNCTNGVFFVLQGNGKTHPTSILYENGITYQSVANHYKDFGCPQSVFIVYKDGKVDMKRIKNLSELNISNVRLAVGGLGLRNTQDPKFYYSPVTEGFKAGYASNGKWKDFSDVLRKANKTVLGYNKRLNKCYLLTVPSITHGDLIKLISMGEEPYDIAISLDGGGSTFMDAFGKYVFQGQNSRRIYNIIGFGL